MTPYLSTPRLITGAKLEAGRNQSRIRLGALTLIGRYYGELNAKHQKKRLIGKRESDSISTLPLINPQHFILDSCITFGLVVGEMVTPTVSKQSKKRNEEKRHQLHEVDNLCGKP